MRHTILLLIAFFASLSLKAQNAGEEALNLPKVIPPSPEVSSLLEFKLAKVDEYTGAGSFSIPITNIAKGSIQVPISLGYRATGLNVNQVASRVGLGWSLNAGGVVSRTILGGADEVGPQSFFSPYVTNSAIYGADGVMDLDLVCNSAYNSGNFFLINEVATGKIDTEADVYSFSLPNGESGKFVFDKDRQLHKFEESEIFIDNPFVHSLAPPQEWTLKDTQGNTYIFRQVEKTLNIDGCSGSNGDNNSFVHSSWLLSEIISVNGQDKVFFDYEMEQQEYHSSISDMIYEYHTVFRDGQDISDRKTDKSCVQQLIQEVPMLSKIRTTWGQEVRFNKNVVPRTDVGGNTFSLQSISLYQGTRRLKEFVLTHSYFQAKSNGIILDDSSPKASRLRLDKLQEYRGESIVNIENGSSGLLPPYEFQYIDHGNFPKRLSTGQDYWGFYNGQDGNSSLVPLYKEELEGIIYADRFPRKAFTEEGMLKSIAYPNGGSVVYEYALNDIPNDANRALKIRESEFIRRSTDGETTVNFTINSPTGSSTILVDYTNSFTEAPATNPENPFNPGQGIEDPAGSVNYVEMIISGGNGEVHYLTPDHNNVVLLLPNGNYTAKINILDASTISAACEIRLDWYSYGATPINWNIGGLRVAKEIHHDGLGNDVSYVYRYVENGTNVSSGKSFQRFRFDYNEYADDGEEINGQCITGNSWFYRVLQSSPIQPLGIGNGGHIGYSTVEKIAVADDDTQVALGKTVSHFINKPMIRSINATAAHLDKGTVNLILAGVYVPDYFMVSQLADSKNGKLIKQEVYETIPTVGLSLKQVSEYQYTELTDSLAKVFNMKARERISSGCRNCNHVVFERMYYWHEVGSRFMLTSETNKVFTDDGKVIENGKSYVYHPTRTLLKETTTFGSVNESFTTKLTYPIELENTDSIYQQLISRNQVATPVITEVNKNGDFLSKQRIAYFDYGNGNILPKAIHTKRGTEAEELRIQYHAYDIKGNPIEFSKTNGIHTSIVWDATGLRPIAQAVNANHNEVWYSSFEDNGVHVIGSWTGRKASIDPLISLPDFAAGTYVLTYWKKDAAESWSMEETTVVATATGLTVQLSGVIDEVKIFPADAQMTTVTYNDFGRIVAESDVNGHVVRYVYDGFGRLQQIKDEQGNIVKGFEYHYHNE